MCDCIKNVNELLAAHNAVLVLPMFGAQRPFIETTKREGSKRGKPPKMQASFCPFCGEQYPEKEG